MPKVGRQFILGVDPGLMTGVAYVNFIDRDNPVLDWAEEMDLDRFQDFIELFLSQNKDVCAVVIEDYIITERTAKLSQQPWSLRLIGVTSYLCRKYNIPLIVQKPSHKQFADDAKLRAIKFWHKGGAGHANDAARHCLVWLMGVNPRIARHFVK